MLHGRRPQAQIAPQFLRSRQAAARLNRLSAAKIIFGISSRPMSMPSNVRPVKGRLMRHHVPILAMTAVLIASGSTAQANDFPDACRIALNAVKALTEDPAAPAAVESALLSQIAKLSKASWAPGYCHAIA